MFRDVLSTWHEPEVQTYIMETYPGFEHRFIRPAGSTCAGTLYKDRPPGNSPENARGLDSYGFADLECAMSFNFALSWVYPFGDPRRIFNQGTPEQVWYLMEQTWTVVGAPSNARIAEDIAGWERVVDKIIEANGCIVADENFRTGRRMCRMHGEGDRKTKLRKRDRKSTQHQELPVHPQLKDAYSILIGVGGEVAAEGK
jgi:hypothetical protein